MNSLQKFGVQELSADEIKETHGGIAPLVGYGLWLLAGIAVGAAITIYANSKKS